MPACLPARVRTAAHLCPLALAAVWRDASGSVAKKKSLHSHPKISQRGIRIVAVYADCDPRCVVRYLNGMPTTESTRVRVERALLRHGFGNLVRGDVHAIAHELPALDSHAHAPPPSANGASSGTTAPRPIVAVVASSGTTVSRKVSS